MLPSGFRALGGACQAVEQKFDNKMMLYTMREAIPPEELGSGSIRKGTGCCTPENNKCSLNVFGTVLVSHRLWYLNAWAPDCGTV